MEKTIEIIKSSHSYSEAAKKVYGSDTYFYREKIKKIIKENNIEFEHKYNKKNFCKFCGKEITGRDRFRKKFCNRSCAASYNNSKYVKRKQKNGYQKFCKNCGKPVNKNSKMFCSNECFRKYEFEERVKKWKNGDDKGYSGKSVSISDFIKKYLLLKNNCKCEKCGWSEKNPITGLYPLQIHHIDGDCTNNKEENLQLLCPNCHSLTETFGRLNKNSKRER